MKTSLSFIFSVFTLLVSAQCPKGISKGQLMQTVTVVRMNPDLPADTVKSVEVFEIQHCQNKGIENIQINKTKAQRHILYDSMEDVNGRSFWVDTEASIPTDEEEKNIYEGMLQQINSPVKLMFREGDKKASIKESSGYKASFFVGYKPIFHPIHALSTIYFQDSSATRWTDTVLVDGRGKYLHDFELISQTATHKKVFFRGRLVTETLSVQSPNTDFIKEHTYFGVCTYEISSKRILSLDFSYKLETDISLDSTEEDAHFTYKAEEKMTIRNQWDSSSSQN
ncbi:MAG: hypothetical protein ACK4R6_06320 [Spirosomataceae bacterium]